MKTHVFRFAAFAAAALIAPLTAHALPNILDVVETGGDNEATDTVTAKWTGVTFSNGIAGEFNNFLVPFFGEEVPAYVDRVHQWTSATPTLTLPPYLIGAEYIMIGNDNRDNELILDVTVANGSIVYLLIDNRRGDGANANPPNLESGMLWVNEQGFVPIITGRNRANNPAFPDEVGIDEAADGAGPGVGVNQWSSVYGKLVPSGTFQLFGPENAGNNMYGVVVKALPEAPRFVGGSGTPLGVSLTIEEGGNRRLDTNSLQIRVDGEALALTDISYGNLVLWTISAKTAGWFPSGSTQNVEVIYSDKGSPAISYTNTFSFTVPEYAVLSSEHAVPAGSVDTATSGFKVRTVQFRDDARWPGADLPNNTQRVEDQLAGRLIDPVTGQAAPNFAIANPDPGSEGWYTLPVINLNQEFSGFGNQVEAGNFQSTTTPANQDQPVPGLPGTDPDSTDNRDNYSAEFIGYLQLEPGLHLFGVNSDDGFRATGGRDPRSPNAVQLGVHSGGRSAANTMFYVEVKDAGIYPVRLVWYDGGGGSSVEFFTESTTTGERVLVNDRANGGLVSYSESTAPTLSASVSPLNGASDVWPQQPLQAQIYEDGATVDLTSIVLTLNGEPVQAESARSGNIVTVRHTPSSGTLPVGENLVTLTYRDSSSTPVQHSHQWSFTVADYTGWATIPANYAVPASSLNLNSSGFLADAYIMTFDDFSAQPRTGFANNNSVEAAEHQINRRFIDDLTGEPYRNLIPAGPENGRYLVPVVNINTAFANAGGFNAGNQFPDSPVPGTDFLDQDWVVVEFITYLELKAGPHQFIVNCDDGFLLSTAPNPEEPGASIVLGIRSPGGGAADTVVNVLVPQDGYYPIRLLWWEGTGGASVEFIHVHPVSGARSLVNDRTRAQAVKAYPVYTGPNRFTPTVTLTAPAANSMVPAGTVSLTADAQVQNSTISKVEFFVNGSKVGEDTSSPYSFAWDAPEAGRYLVHTAATDANGFATSTTPIHVQVGTPLVSVNFQMISSETPAGFQPDFGMEFADQGNGWSYGWDADNSANTRDRDSSNAPNQWYDTLNHTQRAPSGTVWEIELPEGTYRLFGVSGDPNFTDSVFDFFAEGVQFIKGTPVTGANFVSGEAIVTVSDGRLTITNGPTAANNKINFIDIYRVENAEAPRITSISRNGGNITVNWIGGGTLQSATSLTPPVTWNPLGSTGTHTEAIGNNPMKFFRVVR